MPFVSDNAIDNEIPKMKAFLEAVKMRQTIFSNTFQTMPPKERARTLSQIQADHKTLNAFLESSKKMEIVNSGTKFGLENIKQSFQTLLGLWRKTEKSLETFVNPSGHAGGGAAGPHGVVKSEPDRAVEQYAAALKSMGHATTPEMLNEFKTRLSDAYSKAKEKTGGRDLAIHIVQDGPKIKVRMEPK